MTSHKSIAQALSVTPQAQTVFRHLKKRRVITPAEALITYGISRLAACIYELRQAGFSVATKIKKDEAGHRYASYKLHA